MPTLDIPLNEQGQPDYARAVQLAAQQYGVDPSLALKIMQHESNGHPDAISEKGAMGLMQLMPPTAKQYGATNPFDAGQNIEAGVKFLADLHHRYRGDPARMAAAYNWGPGNLDKYLAGTLPSPPLETQRYVQGITGGPLLREGQEQSGMGLSLPMGVKANPGSLHDVLSNLKLQGQAFVTDPENAPTMGGILGGLTGAALTGGQGLALKLLLPILGAGVGGGGGSVVGQMEQGKPLKGVDPAQIAFDAATQAGWEAGGQALGFGIRRTGSSMYASGAGLRGVDLKRDIPGALQAGLEGGRGSLPIFTASGQRRVLNRTGQARQGLMDAQSAAGVYGPTAAESLNRGLPAALTEAEHGAFPISEPAEMRDWSRKFANEHTSAGLPITPTLTDAEKIKEDLQTRGTRSFRAEQQGMIPPAPSRALLAASRGYKEELETRVPGLHDINHQLQGLIGLGQGLNPANLSLEKLIASGMDPELAYATMSRATPQRFPGIVRLLTDLGAFSGSMYATQSPLESLATTALAHASTSPLGQRLLGGSAYTAGRMAPMASRAAHGAISLNTSPQATTLTPEQIALLNSLNPGQR